MAFAASLPGQQAEINVTPLIDVLLVLLIVFMVIAPSMPRGLESEIPQKATVAARRLPPLTVRLTAGTDGRGVAYAVDGREVERSQVARALAAGLGVRANRSVWIEASPGLNYRIVADVVGEAKAAGATGIGLGRVVG